MQAGSLTAPEYANLPPRALQINALEQYVRTGDVLNMKGQTCHVNRQTKSALADLGHFHCEVLTSSDLFRITFFRLSEVQRNDNSPSPMKASLLQVDMTPIDMMENVQNFGDFK